MTKYRDELVKKRYYANEKRNFNSNTQEANDGLLWWIRLSL